MAQQKIVWTALPFGRTADGKLRVTLVVSPRLTPESAGEQVLKAFPEFLDWPATLRRARLQLRVGSTLLPLDQLTRPDSGVWSRLFTDATPVAGFVFKDMSKVNLRSFSIRNVLGFVRRHYGRLAAESGANHPTLLPWTDTNPRLRDMLTELGTRTQKTPLGGTSIETSLPGFDRFFGEPQRGVERQLGALVFGPDSRYRTTVPGVDAPDAGSPANVVQAPLRVLPSEWHDPSGGGTDAPVMANFSSAQEYTFYQANRFYHREPPSAAQRAMRYPAFEAVPAAPAAPAFDFHRIVASYADIPELLRKLGLVIDCALPAGNPIETMITAGNAAGLIQVEPTWSVRHAGDDARPRTAWQADKTRFLPRPRTADHQRGLLHLADCDDGWGTGNEKRGPFDVFQLDPDGTAVKTVNFLLTAQNLVAKSLKPGTDGDVTYTTGNTQPVAALRSGGLGISRHGRAGLVAQNAAAAALKNDALTGPGANTMVLFLEDVLRGYRVDVQQATDPAAPGRWRSLCERSGTFRLIKGGGGLVLPDDEGYVKGASTTSSGDPAVNPDDHYLHEAMFRWTGWSLVAERPGRTIRAGDAGDSQMQNETPGTVAAAATDGNGFAATFVPRKGSIPRLRFGQTYRMRARIVDLAGNSLALDDRSLGVTENATNPVGYWRFEPVDPPVLVHRSRVSEGESLERMVIRSNHDADPAGYLTSSAFAAAIMLPASQDFEYGAVNERHLVPPKSSQAQCEQHGMFDSLFSSPQTIKQGYAIAAREIGSLYDTLPGTTVELVTPHGVSASATTGVLPPALPSPENPVGDRLAGGQYVIHREARLPTPYLPDAASGGVALRAAPGHTLPGVTGPMVLGPSAAVVLSPSQELVLVVAQGDRWPQSGGLRIRLVERKAALVEQPCAETFADAGTPVWDEAQRELTLFVAKGRIVRLRYASFVHKDFLATFGLPQWVAAGAERAFVLGMAQLGCHWMMTPFRPLTLVHATQQPVCLPELPGLTVSRGVGDQHAVLHGPVRLHGPSSGKFEVEAEWDEWVDALDRPGPVLMKRSRGQLGEVPLGENHVNEFDLTGAVDAQIIAPGRDRARGDRHEFGDTKFRLVCYRVRATTRFREYLPPQLYAQRDLVTRLGPVASGPPVRAGAENDPGAPVLLDPAGETHNTVVPSSAPPDEPHLLYAVPTFRWSRGADTPAQLDLTRLGNGLRVYLERPWFSSGDGELLGVVILGENQPFTAIPAGLVPFFTQWGMDPLWDTALPKSRIRSQDFTAAVTTEAVPLQENPAVQVQVVGHRVHWDDARRLWYCDVELEPGASYMPFVRLALVRYQPQSLPAAKISKVVLAEFAQVLPRRRAVFSRTGAQVAVALHGNVPFHGPMNFPGDSEYQDISFAGSQEMGRNKVELVLQTRDPLIDSDLAWSDAASLGSSILAPPSATLGTVMNAASRLFAAPAVTPSVPTVRDRLGATVNLEMAVNLGQEVLQTGPVGTVDPAVWMLTADLPASGGKPARLMLREFERYYTDRTVPEMRAGAVRRRRVVEERLVYAAVFDLP